MSNEKPWHWGVTVRANGQDVVTIESNHLSGMEDIKPYEDVIRTCALNLLAFIGDYTVTEVCSNPNCPRGGQPVETVHSSSRGKEA